MKTLIIYYSHDGNTEAVVNELKPLLNADVLRLETVDEKKRTGFLKYAVGGIQALTKARPELKDFHFKDSVGNYDLIVIGSPVWGGNCAPALNSVSWDFSFENKKVALFVCHLGGKGRALEKLAAQIKKSTIISTADFIQPLKMPSDQLKAAVKEWAEKLKV